MINLLTNAIKFTSLSDRRYIKLTLDATTSRPELPGPRLVDATTTPHTKEDQEPGLVNLVFEIIDSGVGMGEEDVQRLFKRFVQASDRTHLTYGGSGLGESTIQQRRVELMIRSLHLSTNRPFARR